MLDQACESNEASLYKDWQTSFPQPSFVSSVYNSQFRKPKTFFFSFPSISFRLFLFPLSRSCLPCHSLHLHHSPRTTKKKHNPLQHCTETGSLHSLLKVLKFCSSFHCLSPIPLIGLRKPRISAKIPTLSYPPARIPFYSQHLPLRTAKSTSRPRLSLLTPTSVSTMAAPPALGALGLTFTVMRAMQFIGLIIIIGLSSSFVADIVASSYTAPPALIGTLVIVSDKCTPPN